MNYRLEKTEKGPRWVEQKWNEETEKVEETPLPVGQSLSFDPKDFIENSSVFLFKEQTHELMLHEDGEPYTIEEFLNELAKNPRSKFEPHAFYNKPGDLLEIFWFDKKFIVEHLGNGIEICRSFNDRAKIVGAKIWGLKKILLEAYKNCDQPSKSIAIKAFDPESKDQ